MRSVGLIYQLLWFHDHRMDHTGANAYMVGKTFHKHFPNHGFVTTCCTRTTR